MQILKESEEILILTGLGMHPTVQIAGRAIPRVFVRLLVMSTILLCIVLKFRFCALNYERGLDVVLLEFGIGITYVSLLLIYISMMLKSNKIIELFHFIQQVSDQSEYLQSTKFFPNCEFLWSFR